MNHNFIFCLIVIFSIFLGSQITEGVLLLPYWKTLSSLEFYNYYNDFGPTIGAYFTPLTIVALLIPLGTSIYCFLKKSTALKFSVFSTFFALLVLVVYYAYLKETNQQFYEAAFDENELKSVLKTWEFWHWLKVLFESISLVFLMLTLNILSQKNQLKSTLNN